MENNLGLVPLRNFAVVDAYNGIYRSAQPLYSYEYEWLNKVLGIKTIVNLRSELKRDDTLAVQHGMEVIDYEIPDHHCPTIDQAKDFISLIKEGNKFPLLFHCEHGRGRTSTFCVLANIACGMDVKEAITEEETKYHYQFQHQIQKEFLLNNF